MQTINRTLSTTDSHELKLKMLRENAVNQIKAMSHEIKAAESENKKIEVILVGKGAFTRLVKRLLFIALVIAAISCFFIYKDYTLSDSAKFYAYIVGFVILLLYIAAVLKYSKISREIGELEEKIERNNSIIRENRFKMESIETQTAREISKLQQMYAQHMENEVNMLKKDMMNISSEGLDIKECPRCAESIKAKAKICRFCKFEM